ncbi:unnamed protein product [Caenorhabditis auriculariae]|uniref:Uncharacterized protein n=1 Tax=Caenorhabditis auriculariae TaxID=2777116 RepID=A0A8S1HIF6_9PELO|nr:unnamed protein product [Caenorhabditis auriculariae]
MFFFPQLAFPMNPEGSTIEVMIEMDSIDGYARDVHAQIMALIPSELTSTGFITADEFVIMTKWLLKMRLDEIRRQRGIGCQEDHLDFGEIEMPWPLARAINAIGVTSVANNVVILVPTTPPAPLDKALYIRNSMTPMIFYRWYKCLAMLRLTKRPEWQPVFLSNNFDGGVFWALKVVNEKNEVPKNRHEKNLGIVASFSEISVEDVAMAVAVFLGVQFDPVSKDLHYQSRHPIGDVGAFRTALINNLPPHTSS